MNKVYEIVLTGGPCAGKTTGISKIEDKISEKGFKVIVVAETATEVILSGIVPTEISETSFQKVIIKRGINKENTTKEVATSFKKDVVIIYDRGIMDSKAYMKCDEFLKILNENGLSEIEARDKYDAVFHLVTAAIGAEDFYTLENNKARREDIKEAREIDEKIKNAWIGHPHFRVIDNQSSFNEKIDNLLKEVYVLLGIPIPVEIERKFLIKRPSIEELKNHSAVKSKIVQTYLKSIDPSIERRVRQRGIDGKYSYYYTEKRYVTDKTRNEVEKRISKDQYLEYLTEGVSTVRKERYCFLYKNQYFELDIYPDMEDDAILEIELTEENDEVKLPDWILVKKEVTGDSKYSNSHLAR